MNTYPLLSLRHQLLAVSLLAIFFLPASVSALVMRPGTGPEPVIVQIKESLRLSNDLNDSLSDLAQLEQEAGVTLEKWWVGGKLLQLVSFSKETTEEQAEEIIETLQESDAVEKVVPVSGFNLEFKPGDFALAYTPTEYIPEAALRGLSTEEVSCPLGIECDVAETVNLPHVPNQIIIGWKPQYAWQADQTGFRQDITAFHNSAGAHVVQEMTPTPTDLIQVIEFDDPEASLVDKMKEYAKSGWIDYAQPNYIYSDYAVAPNDTFYTNPGQPYLSKIRAPQAWSQGTGDHSVVVAVADFGANIDHPDFRNRLSLGWRNFNANPPNNNVSDNDDFGRWHGAHVASIIGAEGNNGEGTCPDPPPPLSTSEPCGYMAGVAWDVRLLILKRLSVSAQNVAAIDYAYSSDQGHDPAIAINCSWGLGPFNCLDRALTDAIRRARQNNMVIVAAAGNGVDEVGIDMEDPSNLITPASVPTDNVIAVGATRVRPDNLNLDDTKTTFSNFGKYRVELGAPGGDDGEDGNTYGIIGLTGVFNETNYLYKRSSGTSFSAPQVAGALALVKSKYPWEDYAGLRDRVIMGVDELYPLRPDNPTGGFRTGGRLNLEKALQPRTLIKNLSTRARVESGERIIVGGFVIRGDPCPGDVPCDSLKVVIRGRGPSLPPELNPLPNPKLRLNDSNGNTLYANNDWQDDPAQAAELTALGFAPTNANEAAMVRTLHPGSYTVFLESQNTQQGIALFEIYEIRGNTSEKVRLINLSTRCVVGTGDNVAIAGTILQNPGGASGVPKRRILSFGRGPSLQRFGLSPLLPDPKIEFHQNQNGMDVIIASNDQWKDIDSTNTGLEDKLVESKFMPCSSAPDEFLNESAVWPSLSPDAYTAILKDAGNASGIALIEFYEH